MQTFRYVQASEFASSPRSLLPLRVSPQGSRDFSVRAYRALLPPHAPDMLSAGIQVIDGKRTFTFPDLQPCRLLQYPTELVRVDQGKDSAAASAHLQWNRDNRRHVRVFFQKPLRLLEEARQPFP